MNNYTDIGINLINKQFQNDIETIIQNAIDAQVSKMILTGTSVRNSEQSALLAKKYPNVLYATAGIHPHDAKSFDAQSIPKLMALLRQSHVVSVGDVAWILTVIFRQDLFKNNVMRLNKNLPLKRKNHYSCTREPLLSVLMPLQIIIYPNSPKP